MIDNTVELVLYGNFDSDSVKWVKGANWEISGGTAHRTTPYSPPSSLIQKITFIENSYYAVKYYVISSSATSGILKLQGSFGDVDIDSSEGEHLVVCKCVNFLNQLNFFLVGLCICKRKFSYNSIGD